MVRSTCSVPNCDGLRHSGGWCAAHYQRWKRTGDLRPDVAVHDTPADRFWPKVDRSGGPDACWIWLAGREHNGYGMFRTGPTTQTTAHRVAYELSVGPIPAGHQLDHLCRVKLCVNPRHLEPVLPRENVIRERASRLTCPRGHPYTTNSSVWGGRRYCRTCRNEARRQPAA